MCMRLGPADIFGELSQSLGPEAVYVSGRQRPKGEMNGKSGNLNNCARQLYPVVRFYRVIQLSGKNLAHGLFACDFHAFFSSMPYPCACIYLHAAKFPCVCA